MSTKNREGLPSPKRIILHHAIAILIFALGPAWVFRVFKQFCYHTEHYYAIARARQSYSHGNLRKTERVQDSSLAGTLVTPEFIPRVFAKVLTASWRRVWIISRCKTDDTTRSYVSSIAQLELLLSAKIWVMSTRASREGKSKCASQYKSQRLLLLEILPFTISELSSLHWQGEFVGCYIRISETFCVEAGGS